jgi:hypothetical protein
MSINSHLKVHKANAIKHKKAKAGLETLVHPNLPMKSLKHKPTKHKPTKKRK